MLRGLLTDLHMCGHMQEEVDKVLQRAHWEEEAELWVMERLSSSSLATAFSNTGTWSAHDTGSTGKQRQEGCGVMPCSCRPIAVAGAKRPISNMTKAAALSGDMNPRYR